MPFRPKLPCWPASPIRLPPLEPKITIPENLDYDGLFDDLFEIYTRSARLERVRTTNMGTLYELDYRVVLKGDQVPKAFLDALRCRNGNLEVRCGRLQPTPEHL